MLTYQNASDSANQPSNCGEHFAVPAVKKSHVSNLHSAKANRHADGKLHAVHKLILGPDKKLLTPSPGPFLMNSSCQGPFNPVCHGDCAPSAAWNYAHSAFRQLENCEANLWPFQLKHNSSV
jgi:hypothetical protein